MSAHLTGEQIAKVWKKLGGTVQLIPDDAHGDIVRRFYLDSTCMFSWEPGEGVFLKIRDLGGPGHHGWADRAHGHVTDWDWLVEVVEMWTGYPCVVDIAVPDL